MSDYRGVLLQAVAAMSEVARGKRFSLLAIVGYPIWANDWSTPTHPRPTTSYCIVDRDWAHSEVWRDYQPKVNRVGGTRPGLQRRAEALAKLAEFEAECG